MFYCVIKVSLLNKIFVASFLTLSYEAYWAFV